MVFVSRGKGRASGGRGRRGVGEVSFEPRTPQSGNDHESSRGHGDRRDDGRNRGESRQLPPENLRITVGNDQFRDERDERLDGRLSPSVSQRLGPPVDSYNRDREMMQKREAEQYRLEAKAYGSDSSDRYERDRDQERDRRHNNRNPYRSREGREYDSGRPAQREYGDRRGLGASDSYPPSSASESQPSLFPVVSRSSAVAEAAAVATRSPVMPSFPSAPQGATGPNLKAKPLKSILKKKAESTQDKPSERPVGLPGISNYMDDIDDEEKFLYGEDDGKRREAESKKRLSQDSHGSDMRSAVKSWQPSVPDTSVSNFVSAQREYSDTTQGQALARQSAQTIQPTQQAGGVQEQSGDLWSMLAKSVQTVQQQQHHQQLHQVPVSYGTTQQPVYQQTQSQQAAPQQTVSQQPQLVPQVTADQAQKGADYDPTIENILKSIGFDFDMSKRMQEKAKQQAGGEPPPKPVPTEESQYGINHMASFIGSEMSHSEMRSKLGNANKGSSLPEHPGSLDRTEGRDSKGRDEYGDTRDSRERMVESRINSDDMFHESPPRNEQERLQRGCSPVSADGSPPPMFNLPPIKIKRKMSLERNRSPGWERSFRSRSKSPARVSDSGRDSRNRARSRSPSWNRSVSSAGRRHSRSPGRRRSITPPRRRSPSPLRRRSPSPLRRRSSRSPSPRSRNRSSPDRARSPVIRRTINISPKFRRRTPSPKRRSRSPVVHRRISPGRRGSRSPIGRRRSSSDRHGGRSPLGRRRSRSPGFRRKSPLHSNDRRGSPSPRGRKRMHSPRSSRSRSRERKHRRSTSRDRHGRSRSRSRSRSSFSSRGRSRTRSSGSDSDVDGPANKKYFSSPLRLNKNVRYERQYIPPVPPQMPPPPQQMPPQMPHPGYAPMPMYPQFPPPSGMPPFGMPPAGPPVTYNLPPPVNYNYPPPPVSAPVQVQAPAPAPAPAPVLEIAPPGTVDIQMPLNIPSRAHQTHSAPVHSASVEKEKRDESLSKDENDHREKRNSRSSTSSRKSLSPNSKTEDVEKKTSSSSRTIIMGSKSKANEKADSEKKKAKLLKEKQAMVDQIKALHIELNTLKYQEYELKQTKKEGKPDQILEENLKLKDEIKKELNKINLKMKDFFLKNGDLLREDQKKSSQGTIKKEIEVKKEVKKDRNEFEIEKGKLMRHQFVDEGKHWCKGCKAKFTNIHDYVQHLASYKHKQTLPAGFKPWRGLFQHYDGMIVNKNGIRVPLPGIEFLHPVNAYFCELCKVFLGDVSCGTDHFRCESHYLKYQRYLKDNPFYEKKYKEDKEAFLSGKVPTKYDKESSKSDKVPTKSDMVLTKSDSLTADDKSKEMSSKLTSIQVRERERQKKQETENRIREKEKKWDKDVEELDDNKTKAMSQEATKGKIKLNLKNQADPKEEVKEGPENETDDDNSDSKSDEKDKSEKGKIAISINLVGKSLIGKGTVQKKNPLLPAWQPVGKKIETRVTKHSSTTPKLDDFLTSGTGKVPVVVEPTQKKKVTPQEILKAFTGKQKEKLEQEKAREEKARAEAERKKAEKKEAEKKEAEKKEAEKKEAEKREAEKKEAQKKEAEKLAERKEAEDDMKMMGIDPESEKPLAEKKPPPPVSHNVPHPDEKPSSTVSENNVHSVFFNSDKKVNESSQITSLNENLSSIPFPPEPTNNPVKKEEVKSTVEQSQLDHLAVLKDLDSIPLPPPKPKKRSRAKKDKQSGVNKSDSKSSDTKSNEKDDAESSVAKCEDKNDDRKSSDTISNNKIADSKTPETNSNDKPDNSISSETKVNDKTDDSESSETKSNDTSDDSKSSDTISNDKIADSKIPETNSIDKPDNSISAETNGNDKTDDSESSETKRNDKPDNSISSETKGNDKTDDSENSETKSNNKTDDSESSETKSNNKTDDSESSETKSNDKTDGIESPETKSNDKADDSENSETKSNDKTDDSESSVTKGNDKTDDYERSVTKNDDKTDDGERSVTKDNDKTEDSERSVTKGNDKTDKKENPVSDDQAPVSVVDQKSPKKQVTNKSNSSDCNETIEKDIDGSENTKSSDTKTNEAAGEKEEFAQELEEEEDVAPKKGRKAPAKRGRRGRGRGRTASVTPRRSTRSAIAAAVKEIDEKTEAIVVTAENDDEEVQAPEKKRAKRGTAKRGARRSNLQGAQEAKRGKDVDGKEENEDTQASGDTAVSESNVKSGSEENASNSNNKKSDSVGASTKDASVKKIVSPKKNSSPARSRKISTNVEKMDTGEKETDIDDNVSDLSGISMNLGSDFEILDDLDMDLGDDFL